MSKQLPEDRPLIRALAFCLIFASGCVVTQVVLRDDDSERIEQSMAPEQFSEATPGAAGIHLGDDAPPLAQWSEEDEDWLSGAYLSPGFPGYFIPGVRTVQQPFSVPYNPPLVR